MLLVCPVCEVKLHEGDKVVAEVTTTYHQLASKRVYAIDKDITACHSVMHERCYTDDIEEVDA